MTFVKDQYILTQSRKPEKINSLLEPWRSLSLRTMGPSFIIRSISRDYFSSRPGAVILKEKSLSISYASKQNHRSFNHHSFFEKNNCTVCRNKVSFRSVCVCTLYRQTLISKAFENWTTTAVLCWQKIFFFVISLQWWCCLLPLLWQAASSLEMAIFIRKIHCETKDEEGSPARSQL